jgi:hypothetical protein
MLREAMARLDESRARLRARGVKISEEEILSAIRERSALMPLG